MSIQTELTRITNAKTAIKTAIEGKGVTVPAGTLLDGMASLIESIEAGGGGFQVALGTFTPAETEMLNTAKPVPIEHNAGFTPDVFIFYRASSTDANAMIAISARGRFFWGGNTDYYICYVMCKGSTGMGEGIIKAYPATEKVAYLRSSYSSHKITAGQEYRWIAIGGI